MDVCDKPVQCAQANTLGYCYAMLKLDRNVRLPPCMCVSVWNWNFTFTCMNIRQFQPMTHPRALLYTIFFLPRISIKWMTWSSCANAWTINMPAIVIFWIYSHDIRILIRCNFPLFARPAIQRPSSHWPGHWRPAARAPLLLFWFWAGRAKCAKLDLMYIRHTAYGMAVCCAKRTYKCMNKYKWICTKRAHWNIFTFYTQLKAINVAICHLPFDFPIRFTSPLASNGLNIGVLARQADDTNRNPLKGVTQNFE